MSGNINFLQPGYDLVLLIGNLVLLLFHRSDAAKLARCGKCLVLIDGQRRKLLSAPLRRACEKENSPASPI